MGAGSDNGYEIYLMNDDGSNLRQLTDNDFFDSDPLWSPDGMSLSFYSNRGGQGDIFTMDYDGGNVFNVTADPDVPYYEQDWSPDGQQLVMRGGNAPSADLYTIARDGTDLRKINAPLDNPSYPQWSPAGDRIAAYDYTSPDPELVIINTDGTDKVTLSDAAPSFVWSPDGDKLVYTREGIWTVKADGSDPQLLFNTGSAPQISPDGSTIAFVSAHESPEVMLSAIYFMDSDGGNVTRMTDFMRTPYDLDWSANQELMVFVSQDDDYVFQLFRLEIATQEVRQLTFTAGRNSKPQFSPLLHSAYPQTAAPEPATLALLGSGILGLAGMRRRRPPARNK